MGMQHLAELKQGDPILYRGLVNCKKGTFVRFVQNGLDGETVVEIKVENLPYPIWLLPRDVQLPSS